MQASPAFPAECPDLVGIEVAGVGEAVAGNAEFEDGLARLFDGVCLSARDLIIFGRELLFEEPTGRLIIRDARLTVEGRLIESRILEWDTPDGDPVLRQVTITGPDERIDAPLAILIGETRVELPEGFTGRAAGWELTSAPGFLDREADIAEGGRIVLRGRQADGSVVTVEAARYRGTFTPFALEIEDLALQTRAYRFFAGRGRVTEDLVTADEAGVTNCVCGGPDYDLLFFARELNYQPGSRLVFLKDAELRLFGLSLVATEELTVNLEAARLPIPGPVFEATTEGITIGLREIVLADDETSRLTLDALITGIKGAQTALADIRLRGTTIHEGWRLTFDGGVANLHPVINFQATRPADYGSLQWSYRGSLFQPDLEVPRLRAFTTFGISGALPAYLSGLQIRPTAEISLAASENRRVSGVLRAASRVQYTLGPREINATLGVEGGGRFYTYDLFAEPLWWGGGDVRVASAIGPVDAAVTYRRIWTDGASPLGFDNVVDAERVTWDVGVSALGLRASLLGRYDFELTDPDRLDQLELRLRGTFTPVEELSFRPRVNYDLLLPRLDLALLGIDIRTCCFLIVLDGGWEVVNDVGGWRFGIGLGLR
jgi:hypothetical protein